MTKFSLTAPMDLRILTEGRAATFCFLLIVGLAVTVLLLLTVHNRDDDMLQDPHAWMSAADRAERFPQVGDSPIGKRNPRWRKAIEFWIEHGFLAHGGLNFSEPPELNPNARVYSSRPPAMLLFAYLMESAHHWLTGKYSERLMTLHNVGVTWLSSVLLGFLGVRLARRLVGPTLIALLLGMGCQVMYQTFPYNLAVYWEINHMAFGTLFLIVFLILEEACFDRRELRRKITILRGLTVFLMVYFDPTTTILGLGAYVLAVALIDPKGLEKRRLWSTLALPAVSALGLFALQLAWVWLNFSEVEFIGGGFLWRSGLDGETLYVGVLGPKEIGSNWLWMRNIGAFSLAALTLLGLFSKPLRIPVFILLCALGFYLVPTFLMTQSALIHPYLHELYLAIPLMLAAVTTLPAYLERETGAKGFVTFAVCLLVFCCVMYQLRVYAIANPIQTAPTDISLYGGIG